MVAVFLELNGQPRRIKVPDGLRDPDAAKARTKAERGAAAHVGAARSDRGGPRRLRFSSGSTRFYSPDHQKRRAVSHRAPEFPRKVYSTSGQPPSSTGRNAWAAGVVEMTS